MEKGRDEGWEARGVPETPYLVPTLIQRKDISVLPLESK